MNLAAHAGVCAALALATVGVRQSAERAASEGLPHHVTALPAIPFLEVTSLGYRTAAADIAWLQAVQYYGEHRQGGNDLGQFEHYVEAVQTLDPRFEQAGVFGAVVVASEKNDLPGALEILRRSARANPESPAAPFEMGFLTFVQGGDLDAALAYLRMAAQRPGGKERAERFMAFLNRRLGRLETAWLLWNDLAHNAHDPGMRLVAADNLRKVEAALRARQPAATRPGPPAPEVVR
jgi:hypothetical protein